ncbi:MAG: hypothetical protein J5698_00610 [Bacteroidaceae bacterium]|nr:hypothetical protein [Bacteroidaceae bacterium]
MRKLTKPLLALAALLAPLCATAIEQDAEGAYLIGTAQDLQDFSALVNDESAENAAACAVLTADIDMKDVSWTPIGSDKRKFAGTFNGQFHRIKNLVINTDKKEQGLFGVAANATIKHVIIDKSCSVKGTNCASAFVGCCNGEGTLTFIGCGNEANVTGSAANNSAFVGCNYSSGNLKIVIKYCYNTGNISGGWENGVFSGWFASAGDVTGSWNTGRIVGAESDKSLGRGIDDDKFHNCHDLNEENARRGIYTLDGFTEDWLTSGELCYKVNGDQSEIGWYQTLGEDAMPTADPTHKQVYLAGEFYCDGSPKGTFSYTNSPDGSVRDEHEYENGLCKNCGHPDENYAALEDGFYQIGTTAELIWFSALVNRVNSEANAELIADIDLTGVTWEPIGTDGSKYHGTFDGQFHRIKNLVIDTDKKEQGLFGVVSSATIKNLFIDSSCSFKADVKTAAFIGCCNGSGTLTIEGCGNEANVEGTGTEHGNNSAFVGCNYSSGNLKVVIKNCYNKGNIKGGGENGVFSGWFANAGEIRNSFNTGLITEGDGQATLGRGIGDANIINSYDLNEQNDKKDFTILEEFTDAWMTNGALTYKLNGEQYEIGWYQTIGTDAQPTTDPSHGQVYAIGELYCDGTPKGSVTYSNSSEGSIRDEHEYENGVCKKCGHVQGDLAELEDGYYMIGSAEQLAWFAAKVRNDGPQNAKLTADIDMTGVAWTPIGTGGNLYNAKFDGQGHTIEGLNVDLPDQDYVGLFGIIGNGADIRNLIIGSTCSFSGKAFVGGIAGGSNGSGTVYLTNLGNLANISATAENAAGIIGVSMSSSCAFIMENCFNMGDVTGDKESAGLTGWFGDNSKAYNCYNTGTITGAQGEHYLFRHDNQDIRNLFDATGGDQGTAFELEDLESGKLCYMLNGSENGGTNFYQTLGKDDYPVPFSEGHGLIYATGALRCDGQPMDGITYSNTEGETVIPDHEFHDGFCDVCGQADPDFMQPVDGYYMIGTAEQLVWFSAMAALDGTINGKLTDDIDLGGIEWKPIGHGKIYKGKFDGQQHFIESMQVEGNEYVGFFGIVGDGADIRNLIIASTCTVSGTKFVGGIAGGSNGGGKVYFTNCGNEAFVQSSEQNAAGIIGVSMGGSCGFIMNNCYNSGDINGGWESAAFTGWFGTGSEMTGCYNTGYITGTDGDKMLYRNDVVVPIDLYTLVTVSDNCSQGITFEEEDLASGRLAFLVNGSVTGGTRFYQTIGEDDYPIPFSEGHGIVYAHGKLLCDGSVTGDDITFDNEEGEFEKGEHHYGEDGICDICFNAYGISTAQQLFDFSWDVQSGTAQNSECVLLADIDLDGVEFEPIGFCPDSDESSLDMSAPYCGSFDGKGHRIFNMNLDYPDRKYLGLFGAVGGGASIKNVTIDSSCFVNGDAFVGGLVGGAVLSGVIEIENCGNEANVSCTGANAAGIIGVDMLNRATLLIKNCYNTGAIVGGKESAAISGWLGTNARVTNCYNSGTVAGIEDGKPFARFSSATFTNCYDVNGQSSISSIADKQVSSGELCYLLNGSQSESPVFLQTLDEDTHPVFDAGHGVVYYIDGKFTNDLDGIEPIIVNTDTESVVIGVYSINGVRLDTLRQGLNIVRYSDGTVRKVYVK